MNKISILMIAGAMLAPATVSAGIVGEVASRPLSLPYSQTFDDASSMSDFTVFDGNDDGIYWEWDESSGGEAQCAQNPNKAMDDWLITRPVTLVAGTDYYFSIDARRYRASEPERFEVYLGTSAHPDDMTVELIQPTEPADAYKATYKKTIRVQESGTYYIGIHGISDKWKYRMCIDNISLKEGANDSAPGAPSQLKVTPDPEGNLTVGISFVTPNTDVNGNPIESITKAHVFRDDVEIHTFDSPDIRVALEWADTEAPAGNHTYAVAASNASGMGARSEAAVYVGLRRPMPPTEVTLAETSVYGEVRLSWKAPAEDYEGNPLDPLRVTYRITEPVDGEEILVADDITGLNHTFTALEPGAVQQFKDYHVYAKTNGGESYLPGVSTTAAVGDPFELPYRESFAIVNGSTLTPLAISTTAGTGTWLLYDDNEYSLGKIRSQDGDDGYTAMYAKPLNHAARVFTAKLDFGGCEHPAVTFYTYKIAEDDHNEIAVQLSQQGNPFGSVGTVKVSEIPGEGWVKVTMPLTRYRNRVVQLGLLATTVTDAYTPVDNLRVYDMAETDVALCGISAPASVHPGEECFVSVNMENTGYSDVAEAKVELWIDGSLSAVSDPVALVSGAVTAVKFPLSFGVFDAGSHSIELRAVCDGDLNSGDNVAGPVSVTVISNEYPVIGDLRAYAADGGVRLSWTAPDETEYVAPAVMEDFESYPSFATENVGPWTFHDGDKGLIGGIGSGDNELNFPGIEGAQSWWVMDAGYEELPQVSYVQFWEAHSGSKYLMQEYVTDQTGTKPVACDDWIISPELSGREQNISFYAKSYNKIYRETFEILVSYTDNSIESFEEFDREEKITDEWTEYVVAVPEGVKYFAIRCVSDNRMAMFVDDITYVPGGDAVAVHLTGFNVYRDGTRLNDTPVAAASAGSECEFADESPAADRHSYYVTAIYDKGESKPSNEAVAELSGLENVGVDQEIQAPVYYNMQGVRILRPLKGVPYVEVRGSKARKVIL